MPENNKQILAQPGQRQRERQHTRAAWEAVSEAHPGSGGAATWADGPLTETESVELCDYCVYAFIAFM